MRPREDYSWKSIESAPLNEDVTLQVTDGRGEPYLLVNASNSLRWVGSVLAKERHLRSRQ